MRTELITGLDVQFCGFDGFRWLESELALQSAAVIQNYAGLRGI